MPPDCIGDAETRLLVGALWPLGVIAVLLLLLALRDAFLAAHQRGWQCLRGDWRWADFSGTLRDGAWGAIFISYVALPSVAQSVFETWSCESFGYDDARDEKISYLRGDGRVICGAEEHHVLVRISTTFLVLFPVCVPLFYLWLLWRGRAKHNTDAFIATTTRFLWKEYKSHFYWWDPIDIVRRLSLTSFILFVDTEEGSDKLARLIFGSLLCVLFLALTLLAQPYRHHVDNGLACLAQLLLVCCFVSSIALKLCDPTLPATQLHDDIDCYSLVGVVHSDLKIALLLLGASIAVFVSSVAVIFWQVISAARRMPTLRLRATDLEPDLSLPEDKDFHLFISHAWATGQDQTHTIVRQLQLLMPGIQIWLDADRLNDVSRLAESVRSSLAVTVFLSRGYFSSVNCRKELYAALDARLPLILVHEADEGKGGAPISELKRECVEHCGDRLGGGGGRVCDADGSGERVCDAVFRSTPIAWVRVRSFQLVSLRLIAEAMLRHTPFYSEKASSRARELRYGTYVPGDLAPMKFRAPIRLLYCPENAGAKALADELRRAQKKTQPALSYELLTEIPERPHRHLFGHWRSSGSGAALSARLRNLGISERLPASMKASSQRGPSSDQPPALAAGRSASAHSLARALSHNSLWRAPPALPSEKNPAKPGAAAGGGWMDDVEQAAHVDTERAIDLGVSFASRPDGNAPAPTSAELAAAAATQPTHMLVYLNDRVFCDQGKTAAMVRAAIWQRLPLILVHEQDPGRGACAFRRFFELCPQDLINGVGAEGVEEAVKLFDNVATPLYATRDHRALSVLHVVERMGGVQYRGILVGPLKPLRRIFDKGWRENPSGGRRSSFSLERSSASEESSPRKSSRTLGGRISLRSARLFDHSSTPGSSFRCSSFRWSTPPGSRQGSIKSPGGPAMDGGAALSGRDQRSCLGAPSPASSALITGGTPAEATTAIVPLDMASTGGDGCSDHAGGSRGARRSSSRGSLREFARGVFSIAGRASRCGSAIPLARPPPSKRDSKASAVFARQYRKAMCKQAGKSRREACELCGAPDHRREDCPLSQTSPCPCARTFLSSQRSIKVSAAGGQGRSGRWQGEGHAAVNIQASAAI